MIPFLLITTREDHQSALAEYQLYRTHMRLEEHELTWKRADQTPVAHINPHHYAGIVLAGSPYTISTAPQHKSATEFAAESQLQQLMARITAADTPFLGICYGMGTLGAHLGATVDQSYGEPSGSAEIHLTTAGQHDALFAGSPQHFTAYVGHKESTYDLPPDVQILATSAPCPIQAIRIGNNVYATQYHPELTNSVFAQRVTESAHLGYFAPTELNAILTREQHTNVTHSHAILTKFAAHYGNMPSKDETPRPPAIG